MKRLNTLVAFLCLFTFTATSNSTTQDGIIRKGVDILTPVVMFQFIDRVNDIIKGKLLIDKPAIDMFSDFSSDFAVDVIFVKYFPESNSSYIKNISKWLLGSLLSASINFKSKEVFSSRMINYLENKYKKIICKALAPKLHPAIGYIYSKLFENAEVEAPAKKDEKPEEKVVANDQENQEAETPENLSKLRKFIMYFGKLFNKEKVETTAKEENKEKDEKPEEKVEKNSENRTINDALLKVLNQKFIDFIDPKKDKKEEKTISEIIKEKTIEVASMASAYVLMKSAFYLSKKSISLIPYGCSKLRLYFSKN